MLKHWRRAAPPLLLLMLTSTQAQQVSSSSADGRARASASGRYQVTFSSRLEPIVINRIHSWVIHVETTAGAAVTNATITVTGGMPAHDHGLPTSPRMTQELGAGDYLIEGMKFHMNGAWVVTFKIDPSGDADTVTFYLQL